MLKSIHYYETIKLAADKIISEKVSFLPVTCGKDNPTGAVAGKDAMSQVVRKAKNILNAAACDKI